MDLPRLLHCERAMTRVRQYAAVFVILLLATLPLTITLGGAMAQLVEIPVLRLRERWTVTATARRPSAVHSRRLEPCPIS